MSVDYYLCEHETEKGISGAVPILDALLYGCVETMGLLLKSGAEPINTTPSSHLHNRIYSRLNFGSMDRKERELSLNDTAYRKLVKRGKAHYVPVILIPGLSILM